MFTLFKLIIWIAGVSAVTVFGLNFFGYEINQHYWDERKSACQEKLSACRTELMKNGIDGAKNACDWKCVDPKLIIKKQEKDVTMPEEALTDN